MNDAEKAIIQRSQGSIQISSAGVGWEVFRDGSRICTSISYSDNWTGERYRVGQIIDVVRLTDKQ